MIRYDALSLTRSAFQPYLWTRVDQIEWWDDTNKAQLHSTYADAETKHSFVQLFE